MANVTVSVSDSLKREMEGLRMINWSEIAREAFSKTVEDLKLLKSITSKSKMSEADAISIGRRIRKGIGKRHEENNKKKIKVIDTPEIMKIA